MFLNQSCAVNRLLMKLGELQFSSVQLLSRVRLFATPWTAACPASRSISNFLSFLKLTSIESVMPSNHLILCRLLLLLSSIFASIRVFSSESVLTSGSQSIGVSASTLVFPMNIQDWFPSELTGLSPCSPKDSQESSPTPQFKSIDSSGSVFFIVQLSHPYMTTRKTMALTRQTFVGKIMSLLFNMLSRLVIAFLPRTNCLLISWLQSPSAVIWNPRK